MGKSYKFIFSYISEMSSAIKLLIPRKIVEGNTDKVDNNNWKSGIIIILLANKVILCYTLLLSKLHRQVYIRK